MIILCMYPQDCLVPKSKGFWYIGPVYKNKYRGVTYKCTRAFGFAEGEFLTLPLRSLFSYTTEGETLNTLVYVL